MPLSLSLTDTRSAGVLFVCRSPNEAERLNSCLRNAGMSVQACHADSEDVLRTAVGGQSLALVVYVNGDNRLSLKQTIRVLDELDSGLVTLCLIDDTDKRARSAAIRDGAHDVIFRDDTDHLGMVITRELQNHKLRQAAVAAELKLAELESARENLGDSDGAAFAYVIDGMHLHANSAYLDIFHCDSLDDLIAVPFMDLMNPAEHAAIRKGFKRMARQRDMLVMEVEGLARDAGRRFVLELRHSRYEGENCLQINVLPVNSDRRKEPDNEPDRVATRHQKKAGAAAELSGLQVDDLQLKLEPVFNLQDDVCEGYLACIVTGPADDDKKLTAEKSLEIQKSGHASALDRWMLGQLLDQMDRKDGEEAENPTTGAASFSTVATYSVFATLNKDSLKHPDLLLWLSEQLKKRGIDPRRLNLQLPAHEALLANKHMRRFVAAARQLKIGFGLQQVADDEELEQLLQVSRFDFVWIEEGIIRKQRRKTDREMLIKIMQRLATAGIRSIAHSVTDSESMAAVWTAGMSWIHGSYVQQSTAAESVCAETN